jgi:RNase P subunit RPR2
MKIEEVLTLKPGWQVVDSIQTKCDGCPTVILLQDRAVWTYRKQGGTKTIIYCLKCGKNKEIIMEVKSVVKARRKSIRA